MSTCGVNVALAQCLKCESRRRHRGLLRDYELLCGLSFFVSSSIALSVAPQFYCFLCSGAQLSMVPWFETKKYRQLRLPPTQHQYRTLLWTRRERGGGGQRMTQFYKIKQVKIKNQLANACSIVVDMMTQIEEKTILLVLVWDGSVPEE